MSSYSGTALNNAGTPKMRVWMSDMAYESSVMWVDMARRRKSDSLRGYRDGGRREYCMGTYSWLIHLWFPSWNADKARGPVIVSSSGAKRG